MRKVQQYSPAMPSMSELSDRDRRVFFACMIFGTYIIDWFMSAVLRLLFFRSNSVRDLFYSPFIVGASLTTAIAAGAIVIGHPECPDFRGQTNTKKAAVLFAFFIAMVFCGGCTKLAWMVIKPVLQWLI